ncbi:efflux RND transporter periplasmic adaptor subunit [Stieleria varia]|uniref:Multidrug resistance protein MdtA n=1 Tax=Stieleria varia TaxID=2528005 RepID=A0A5C6AP70_9BACT|nr:efflux RND transporter periplasmic adaptor subunit [Stieleria varia]TWU01307.1 Multidrug resistance protein MdtA precursor [Stieleria varia]
MTDSGTERPRRRWLSVVLNAIICLSILGGSVAGVWLIYRTGPTAKQIETKRRSAALVETITVRRDDYAPQLSVLGTVQPAQDIVLSPRVRGEIIKISPSFVPGGMVREGEMLLQIDPADFENTVSVRQSELEQVEADWEIEVGRRKLAEQELELLGDSISGINRALVLREPQSASLKSQLSAAKAALERAKLDLERTKLIAPFDAQVLRQAVNVGSQVGPGDDLGQLVGIDEYWVLAAVPLRSLRWIKFPTDDQSGSVVTLHHTNAWAPDVTRTGYVARMIGAVDQQTRLARVLVTVDDPLGKKSNSPPLILDTLIEARIEGTEIPDVVRLNREHVHDGDTLWAMKDEKLEIRVADIVFQDPQFAYIRSGLEDGDQVVTTTLATVAEGVRLRKIDSPDEVETPDEVNEGSPEEQAEPQTPAKSRLSWTSDQDARGDRVITAQSAENGK